MASLDSDRAACWRSISKFELRWIYRVVAVVILPYVQDAKPKIKHQATEQENAPPCPRILSLATAQDGDVGTSTVRAYRAQERDIWG